MGPFDSNPFDQAHFSPLMARDKLNGNVRIIVDLSWPTCQSVNTCTLPDMIDNVNFKLNYLSTDLLVQKLVLLLFYINWLGACFS